MARIPGIEVDELCAKYKLHPQLIDIYVEGEFDRDFLVSLLASKNLSSQSTVVPIDKVELSQEFLLANKLSPSSNKHKVKGLALILSNCLQGKPANVSCIVDVDHDLLLNRANELRHLLYTDYTCMEMYCLNTLTLTKFFTLTCNLKIEDMNDFLQVAERSLPVLFCLRAVNENLALNSPMTALKSGFTAKRDITSFDKDKYLEAFIHQNNLYNKKPQIVAEFEKLFNKLSADLRFKSQGHDFIELLFEYVWTKGGPKFHSKEEGAQDFGGRILTSTIDAAAIFGEALFARLETAFNKKAMLW